ncbi:hypothetical protein BXZ70DRAFT_929054 [Cristinia sonorae]|uniref:Uncharacterized protein n=1 Tax=Cristinia sonorae TaxID=1940300 RepID=A0A8K0USS6_9AGAR|nr:hypothetical protein BXZ70DRAFT_929054 [Cristinia sonorae]
MSEKMVRTHHHVSNRNKGKEVDDSRVVYKSALDNPFQISWPKVPMNVQTALLADVIALLDGMAEYHRLHRMEHRKSKKSRAKGNRGPSMADPSTAPEARHLESARADAPQADTDITETMEQDTEEKRSLNAPPVSQSLTVGINAVTQKLEALSNRHRNALMASEESILRPSSLSCPLIVFVCKEDIDPPILISHLPPLVAACNTIHPHSDPSLQVGPSLLVPLPRGSEATLALTLGLRRVSVLAIDSLLYFSSETNELLKSVPILTASWLAPHSTSLSKNLLQTHIKQIRTTAPKNMKTAKERRVQARLAAKERRKLPSLRRNPDAKQRETLLKNVSPLSAQVAT